MPFLVFLGDLHPELSGAPSQEIGNTIIETTLNQNFYANGSFQVNFNAKTNVNSNFGIKDFFSSTYNPISDYNSTFSIDNITSSFVTNKSTVFASTNSGLLINFTYRTISSPPFYVGNAPIDLIYENVCPDNDVFHTALALDSPDAGETYYFSEKFKPYFGKRLTESAASVGLFAPYIPTNDISFFSIKVLKALNSNQFSSRLNRINSDWDYENSSQNFSLYTPASEYKNRTNLFLSFDIEVNETLDSKKFSSEYYLRKSGFQGVFFAPLEFTAYDRFNSVTDYFNIQHEIYQVATINSADKINFKNHVAARSSIKTAQFADFPHLRIVNGEGGIGVSRESFCGNSPFFDSQFVTISFSGCYKGYTLIKDSVENTGRMQDTFSTILNAGDFLGIANLCIGKTPDSHSESGYYSDTANMMFTQNVFSLIPCQQAGGFVFHNGFGTNAADPSFDYLNHDYIIAEAAKEMQINYPNSRFNLPKESGGLDYNNYLTTYWSNNLT